jgi:hypothetical protein
MMKQITRDAARQMTFAVYPQPPYYKPWEDQDWNIFEAMRHREFGRKVEETEEFMPLAAQKSFWIRIS